LASSGPWTLLAHQPAFHPGAMLLLTDGSVMVQDRGQNFGGSRNWWRLKPDAKGNYVTGTWSRIASLPANYGPTDYASAVLPDGRVIVEGGEHNFGNLVFTNQGAIYDPLTNRWTRVPHPTGAEWIRIGDAPSTVLADGRFMLGASGFSGTTAEAILDPKTLTWTATGSGKADGNGEQGWTLLPDGQVLTVDALNVTPNNNTELYDPTTGAWGNAEPTPVTLYDSIGEIGPQILRPDATVFAVGANGQNAIYDSNTGFWSTGPSFPVINGQQYDSADGPAAVLPDGNVLIDASPGVYLKPAHFFVFDGTNLTQVADDPVARFEASDDGSMLILPTGQILYNDRAIMMVYTDTGAPQPSWQPIITSVPTTLTAGHTYTISGTQLNGLTQGAAYGDDYEDSTNYPLVRITDTATGHITYARTANMTSMSVAPNTTSSANFTVPPTTLTGKATLVVVANGIPSTPTSVTIK